MDLSLIFRALVSLLALISYAKLSESTDNNNASNPTSQNPGGSGDGGSQQPKSTPTPAGTHGASTVSGQQPKPPSKVATPGGSGGSQQPKPQDSTSSKTAIELDINDKKSNDKYTYTPSGDGDTYEAKDNYAFKKVYEKKRICSDKTVWETSDPKQYAIKVVYEENKKTVTIHLGDGTTKKFQKGGGNCCGCNKTWSEIVQVTSSQSGSDSQPTSKSSFNDVSPSNVKIFTQAESSSEPKENDTNNYELKEDDGNFFSYKFKDNAKCVEIKFEDKTAWKYDDQNSKDQYPKALYFHKGFKLFFFELTDELYYLYRFTKVNDQDQWIYYSLTKVISDYKKQIFITILDGTKSVTSDKYSDKDLKFALEITPNEGVKITSVSRCPEKYKDSKEDTRHTTASMVWQHFNNKHKENYPKAVYLFKDQGYLIVFEKTYEISVPESQKNKKHELGSSSTTGAGKNASSTPSTDGSQGTTPPKPASGATAPGSRDGGTQQPSSTQVASATPAATPKPSATNPANKNPLATNPSGTN